MDSLLVLISVLPSTTVSEALNLPDKLVAAIASSTPFDASHAAPKPWAARTRNSLRFIGSSVTTEGLMQFRRPNQRTGRQSLTASISQAIDRWHGLLGTPWRAHSKPYLCLT